MRSTTTPPPLARSNAWMRASIASCFAPVIVGRVALFLTRRTTARTNDEQRDADHPAAVVGGVARRLLAAHAEPGSDPPGRRDPGAGPAHGGLGAARHGARRGAHLHELPPGAEPE